MSASKTKHRASNHGAHPSQKRGEASQIALAAAFGALSAFVSGAILLLVFTAISLGADDPTAKAPLFGLAALALSSLAAGIVFTRLGHTSPVACAVFGAGIAAVVLAVSFLRALPEMNPVIPKALGAAIPLVCSVIGGAIAAPRRTRRRRR